MAAGPVAVLLGRDKHAMAACCPGRGDGDALLGDPRMQDVQFCLGDPQALAGGIVGQRQPIPPPRLQGLTARQVVAGDAARRRAVGADRERQVAVGKDHLFALVRRGRPDRRLEGNAAIARLRQRFMGAAVGAGVDKLQPRGIVAGESGLNVLLDNARPVGIGISADNAHQPRGEGRIGRTGNLEGDGLPGVNGQVVGVADKGDRGFAGHDVFARRPVRRRPGRARKSRSRAGRSKESASGYKAKAWAARRPRRPLWSSWRYARRRRGSPRSAA